MKARGTAALKPSPVRSAESDGHVPVSRWPALSVSPSMALHSDSYFLLLLLPICLSVFIIFLPANLISLELPSHIFLSDLFALFAWFLLMYYNLSLHHYILPLYFIALSFCLLAFLSCFVFLVFPFFLSPGLVDFSLQVPLFVSLPVPCFIHFSRLLLITKPPLCPLLIVAVLILAMLICLVLKRSLKLGR